MMFATLEVQQDPPRWSDLLPYLVYWVQVAGSVAAIALAFWALHYFAEKQHRRQKKLSFRGLLFVGLCVVAAGCYLGFFGSLLLQGPIAQRVSNDPNAPLRYMHTRDQFLLSTAGGLFA